MATEMAPSYMADYLQEEDDYSSDSSSEDPIYETKKTLAATQIDDTLAAIEQLSDRLSENSSLSSHLEIAKALDFSSLEEDSSSDEDMDLEEDKILIDKFEKHEKQTRKRMNFLTGKPGYNPTKTDRIKSQLNNFYRIAFEIAEQDLNDLELLREKYQEVSDLQNAINIQLCQGRSLDCNGDNLAQHIMSIIESLNTVVNIIGDLYPDMDEDS